MPSLPRCEDFISPGLELEPYQDRIIKELAKGMRKGESPEAVLRRLMEDPSLKVEAEKFIKYGDTVFSRIEEPQIREKYNRQILELRREREEESRRLGEEENKIQKDTQQHRDTLQSLEEDARELATRYKQQIKSALPSVKPLENYTRGGNMPFLSWVSNLYRSFLNKYYRLRGYNPATAGEELSYLLNEIRNPLRNRGGL